MRIDAIVEATITDTSGSVSIVSLGDKGYRLEFGLLDVAPRPSVVIDEKRLRLILDAIDGTAPTNIPATDSSPRLYVKPDEKLVEIAAEIGDKNCPTDWIDATVKRNEFRNAIEDILNISK